MSSSLQLRADIEALLPAMSRDELTVIKEICRRVDWARAKYGPLDLSQDRRNMLKEGQEEALDMCFYLATSITKQVGDAK